MLLVFSIFHHATCTEIFDIKARDLENRKEETYSGCQILVISLYR